jgi:plasmid stability protein
MSVMIQVRNVPDALHRELVRRADALGMSLTAYVQSVLEREVGRPSRAEVLRMIQDLEPVELDRPAAEYIREDRGPLPE